MLTSARSAGFWLRLCHAEHLDGAQALVGAFGRAEEAGKRALLQHSYEHTRKQIAQVTTLSALNTSRDVTQDGSIKMHVSSSMPGHHYRHTGRLCIRRGQLHYTMVSKLSLWES